VSFFYDQHHRSACQRTICLPSSSSSPTFPLSSMWWRPWKPARSGPRRLSVGRNLGLTAQQQLFFVHRLPYKALATQAGVSAADYHAVPGRRPALLHRHLKTLHRRVHDQQIRPSRPNCSQHGGGEDHGRLLTRGPVSGARAFPLTRPNFAYTMNSRASIFIRTRIRTRQRVFPSAPCIGEGPHARRSPRLMPCRRTRTPAGALYVKASRDASAWSTPTGLMTRPVPRTSLRSWEPSAVTSSPQGHQRSVPYVKPHNFVPAVPKT